MTRTGITGGESALPADTAQYLAAVKAASSLPVCAGFGVRRAEQVALIGAHADGVIVGSALVEVLERGADPAVFLRRCVPELMGEPAADEARLERQLACPTRRTSRTCSSTRASRASSRT